METGHRVVGIFNKDGVHWVAFCVIPGKTTHVLIKDSYGGDCRDLRDLLVHVCARNGASLTFHFGKQKQQFDSVSCGVFALLNAAELVLMNTDALQRDTDLDEMECLEFLGKGRNENSWQRQTFPEVLEMRERLKFLYFVDQRAICKAAADVLHSRERTRKALEAALREPLHIWVEGVKESLPFLQQDGINSIPDVRIDSELAEYTFALEMKHLPQEHVTEVVAWKGCVSAGLSTQKAAGSTAVTHVLVSESIEIEDSQRLSVSGSVTQAALEDALTLPPEQSLEFGSFLSVADPAATLADSDAPMWMSLMPRVFRCVCPLGWYMCERARDVMCSVQDFFDGGCNGGSERNGGGYKQEKTGGIVSDRDIACGS